ncbi:DUF1778 domain-containing protein [Bosea sp. SSUT16]|uniref:DUF1778 domain-containing protein n=1 Tax=Bosea spartocytisi TaxID=2773451 RepID=A0A927E785_9HYPH|nr:DUF1778 domain-containing protein [Bosea spartocytisi]
MNSKSDRLYIRVTEAEKALIQAAADRAGHPVSRFVVAAALAAARKVK